jgi:hypothetical protein
VARSDAIIYFKVDEDTTYQMSGNFGGTGNGVDHYLMGLLYSLSAAPGDFSFYQYGGVYPDAAHPNPSLALGVAPFDFQAGSLTGVLHANEVYFFGYTSILWDNFNLGGDSTGSGSLQLKIGAGFEQSVPDSPATLGLLLLGLSIVAAAGRRGQTVER